MGDPNVEIPGYTLLPIVTLPQIGDVIGNGEHVGIVVPLPPARFGDGQPRPGTISAAFLKEDTPGWP